MQAMDYMLGARIEIHPRLDAWMAGDRFGVVVKVTRTRLHVLMDRSGRTRRILPTDVNNVISTRA